MGQVHKVEFWPSDWLVGTKGLSNAQCAVYITTCALIYDTGGPVSPKQVIEWRGGSRGSILRTIDDLVALGKLTRTDDGMLDNRRCEKELSTARHRIARRAAQRSLRPDTEPKSESDLSQIRVEKRVKYESPEIMKNNGLEDVSSGSHQPSAISHKDSEPKAKPSPESEIKNQEGVLGRRANAASFRSAPPEPNMHPPSLADRAAIDALADRAKAALAGRSAVVRDPVARDAAITNAKFAGLIRALHTWSGEHFTDYRLGEQSEWWRAQAIISGASEAGCRSGMPPPLRRDFDRLVALYRTSCEQRRAA